RTGPTKTNPPLIIDADRVLTLAISFQGFEPVCWRHPQGVQRDGRIKHSELPSRDREYVGREALRAAAMKDSLGDIILEAADHIRSTKRYLYLSTIRSLSSLAAINPSSPSARSAGRAWRRPSASPPSARGARWCRARSRLHPG